MWTIVFCVVHHRCSRLTLTPSQSSALTVPAWLTCTLSSQHKVPFHSLWFDCFWPSATKRLLCSCQRPISICSSDALHVYRWNALILHIHEVEYVGVFPTVIRLVKPALIPFFFPHEAPFLMCVLSLSLVQRRHRPAHPGLFLRASFERLVAEAELSESRKIDIPGWQKTRSSDLLIVVCPLFFLSRAAVWTWIVFFIRCSFDDFFFGDFSPKAEQHVACSKKTATFHSIFADLRNVHAYFTPLFPFLLFFGYGRSYLSTVRADSLTHIPLI